MKYPTLTELNASREMIDVFRGYNHNLRIGEGEFYDMTNLTSANYPVLSPRPKRGVYASPNKPTGMISKDALCYVDGKYFVINGYKVDMGLSDEPKTLISMGAYVIVMPDKKYINTHANEDDGSFEHGSIEASVTTEEVTTFSLCKLNGEEYDVKPEYITDTAPENPENLDLWIDISSTPPVLKQYAATTATWTSVATTYIKISATGIGKPFEVNDGVTISGITEEDLSDLNNTMVIWEKGDDYIIVTGMLDRVISLNTPITITRKMPNMDFIIESNNRLWGCRYGVALNGEVVNEIYASKLGDFKNWNCFAGISTDSYAATVGTDGQFTGAVTHLGYPLFFKENYIHKVYGNYPANYQIQTTACRGVQMGCSKSLAIVNEVLYYKSRSAVCAYDGSLPAEISSALGDATYVDAVAGVLGNKYYISMRDANYDPTNISDTSILSNQSDTHLFVYDTQKGMWHREDNTQVIEFCNCRGNLYYIAYDADGIKKIMAIRELGGVGKGDESEPIKWQAVTGIIGTDSPDKKYISSLNIRLYIEVGASVTIYAEYDSSGEWEHLYTKSGTKLGSFTIPVRPKRCDHMRLRIDGTGVAKIYSICKTIEQGSDV